MATSYMPNYYQAQSDWKDMQNGNFNQNQIKNNANTVLDPANIFGGRSSGGDMSFGPAPFAPPAPDWSSFANRDPFHDNKLNADLTLTDRGPLSSNLDSTALSQLRGEATAAPGTSAWEALMNQRQDVTDQQQRDAANSNAANGNEAAQSALAASGGISGGARERLGKSAATNSAEARQGVASNSAAARLGIGTQAEQNRISLLSAQPGQELNAANYKTGIDTSNRDYSTGIQNTNINNVIAAKNNLNGQNLTQYQSQMQDWASMNAANATAKGGKK